jgi:hypothetical protein
MKGEMEQEYAGENLFSRLRFVEQADQNRKSEEQNEKCADWRHGKHSQRTRRQCHEIIAAVGSGIQP